jgi:peptide/nickel transport system permease protein
VERAPSRDATGAPENRELTQAVVAPEVGVAPGAWQLFWRRFRGDTFALGALTFLALVILAALFAPLIVKVLGHPPNEQYPEMLDPSFGTPTGPSWNFPFGVDAVGSDVFSRVLYGARVSLLVAFVGTFFATVIGGVLGTLAGFYRGKTDTFISRIIDIVLAFPVLLLALGIASACSLGNGCLGGIVKPGITTVIGIIVLFSWTYVARLVRGQVLSLREKEFVEAAHASGASTRVILTREIFPNLVTPLVVYSALIIPQNILLEAALSYLGVGIAPPQASWGQMIAEATPLFDSAWWYFLFPGVALVLTVLAFNLVGEGIRDALDPYLAK